jgi:putative membrane protein
MLEYMENAIDYQRVDMPRYIIPTCLGLSAVAALFLFWLIYGREASTGYDVSYLSAVNATLNAASAISLFAGLAAIRNKNWKLHRNLMLLALLFSALFLVSYIIYHTFHGDSHFLGQGWIRPVYIFILISHIVLSVVALPLILITVSLSLTRRFAHHKKWARWTFPIWAYVSVTGVAVFVLLKSFGSG